MRRKLKINSIVFPALLISAGLQGITPDLSDLASLRLLKIIHPHIPDQRSSHTDDLAGEHCGVLLSENSLACRKLTHDLLRVHLQCPVFNSRINLFDTSVIAYSFRDCAVFDGLIGSLFHLTC